MGPTIVVGVSQERGEAGADGMVGLGGAVLPGVISEGLVLAGPEASAGGVMVSLRWLVEEEAAWGSRLMDGGCGKMMGNSHRCRGRKAVWAILQKSTVGFYGRGLTWTWIFLSKAGVVWMGGMLSRRVVDAQDVQKRDTWWRHVRLRFTV